MVKSELVQKLCDMHPNIFRKDIEKMVEIIVYEMIEALKRDEAIEIRGWGKIKTVVRKARMGRNPKNSVVAVTKGLMSKLNKKELEDLINEINPT